MLGSGFADLSQLSMLGVRETHSARAGDSNDVYGRYVNHMFTLVYAQTLFSPPETKILKLRPPAGQRLLWNYHRKAP